MQHWPVRELAALDRPALERHLLALDTEDRRLRFGIAPSDTAISAYVEGIDFDRDGLFGVFDEKLQLLGAALLGRAVLQKRARPSSSAPVCSISR